MLFTLGGSRNAFAALYKPITEDTGWTRAAVAGAIAVWSVAAGMAFLAAGIAVDRYGPRKVVPIFALIHLVGYLVASRSTHLWQFYLGWGLLGGVGFGIGMAPLLSITARWFQRHRGLVLGIAASAPHAGAMLFSPVTALLIGGIGWRWTFLVLGVIPFVALIVAARFLYRSPQEVGLLPFGAGNLPAATSSPENPPAWGQAGGTTIRRELWRRDLWWLCLIYATFGIATGLVFAHLVNHGTDKGLSAVTAAGLLSVLSGLSIAGRLGVGVLADHVRLGRLLTFSVGPMAISVGLLSIVSGSVGLYTLAAAFGLFLGGAVVLQSIVARAIFGERTLGTALGFALLSANVGSAVGALLGGAVFDWTDSYTPAFLIAAGATAVATAATLRLRV